MELQQAKNVSVPSEVSYPGRTRTGTVTPLAVKILLRDQDDCWFCSMLDVILHFFKLTFHIYIISNLIQWKYKFPFGCPFQEEAI